LQIFWVVFLHTNFGYQNSDVHYTRCFHICISTF